MKRVADVVAETLAAEGIRHVFMITGGGAMHLNDAFGRCKALTPVFNHHEQASAMAAESYGRLSGRLAAVNVTTGPGGINALNGVYGAYTDSIGMVVVSGQVKRETLARNFPIPLRQLGDQEVDIVPMARPVTKYATVLQDPLQVKAVVRRAVYLARHGRPGPVWIDVPIDVQAALVDETRLADFDPGDLAALKADPDVAPNTLGDFEARRADDLGASVRQIVERLRKAKRPVVFAGAGVRIAGVHAAFLELVGRLGIPVVTGWNAHDVLPNGHPCYAGRPGTVGDRGGNFTVQNADFLLVLGSRLNIRQVSYNWKSFGARAWKAHVDVDPAELDKHTLATDLKVHADLRDFLPAMRAAVEGWSVPEAHAAFLAWCRERVARYPVLQKEYWKTERVNPYCFMDRLFAALGDGDVVVTGDGTACVASFQAGEIKPGLRLYTNSGSASMGYDLPAAVGAAVTGEAKRVICLAGDGSIMMNLQELQTIVGMRLPVAVFVLNNEGYHSIRQTQKAYFSDNLVGIGPQTGVTFPDFTKLAAAFGFPASRISSHAELERGIALALGAGGPALCEVMLDIQQDFAPKLASRRLPDGTMVSPSLEDMAPFLSREEMADNLLGAE